jgi:hypothetical protein
MGTEEMVLYGAGAVAMGVFFERATRDEELADLNVRIPEIVAAAAVWPITLAIMMFILARHAFRSDP